MATPDPENIIEFQSSLIWEQWLGLNHNREEGIWLKIAKKGKGIATVTYLEAVEVALCFGWIDGQMKSVDDVYFVQKFTPRRPKSIWSKINTERAEKLIMEGRMRPPGMAQIEQAKSDGRWDRAYSSAKGMIPPDDFLSLLQKNKVAAEFYNTLNRSNQYAILFRIETAKRPETREKRIKEIIGMLSLGRKFH